MKKIALLGIAAGVVLGIGIFANIGLFGNNALAAEPSTEEKIKIIFRQILNPEFGLKEIKNEVRAIEEKLDGKPDIKHVTDSVTLDGSTFDFAIKVSCNENFQVKSVFAVVDDPDNTIDIRYLGVRADGDFDGTGINSWFLGFVSFDPTAILSPIGYELLSQM